MSESQSGESQVFQAQTAAEGTLLISTRTEWNFVDRLDANFRNGLRLQDLAPWGIRLFGIAFLGLLIVATGYCSLMFVGPIAFGLVVESLQRQFLQISADGICWTYGNRLLPGVQSKFRHQKLLWSQLAAVAHRHEPASFLRRKHRDIVCLRFRNGQQFDINLEELSAEQREQFFLLLSQFAAQDLYSSEALFIQSQSLCGNQDAGLADFTQLWLDEFRNRFELTSHQPLDAGAVIGGGRFVINMPLAIRATSASYLGRTRTSERVVIKEIGLPVDCTQELSAKQLQQFDREASFLSALRHPRIVPIKDHFVENGRSYIVMAHILGTNLRSYVSANGPVGEEELTEIIRQTAETAAYLHEQTPAVIHRDLTPDNIIYAPDTRETTIIDFGAANTLNAHGTSTLVGKQCYMPPEQFRGKPEPASDVYALGATWYFLATGIEPRPMTSLRPNTLSKRLADLIEQCTALDAGKRPTCADILMRLSTTGEHVSSVGSA